MSEKYKLKYEVIAILKENIEMGLASFGLPITQNPGDSGWLVMASDQPSFRNAENAVLFFLEKSERIGWQGNSRYFDKQDDHFWVEDHFIEQQIWKIRVISKRTTENITEENIPLTVEDVASMLIAWFNRLGCNEFRKHNMANLFVQQKDMQVYQGKSEVPQWVAEFPLKLQVIKQFEQQVPWANLKYDGAYGV